MNNIKKVKSYLDFRPPAGGLFVATNKKSFFRTPPGLQENLPRKSPFGAETDDTCSISDRRYI